jgi:hypothetical protein
MVAYDLLKRGDEKKRGGALLDFELRKKASRRSSKRRLLCRDCGSPVTAEKERVAVDGHHVHHRSNPAGIEFEFGCFSAASGAAAVGVPTAEFSWFAGYTWVFSVCRACGAHLGWFFEGGGPPFHAMILVRLVQEGPEGTLH